MKNVFLIICLYIVGNLVFLSNLFPQDVNYNIADIEKVRERFVEAFGGDFVITEESFKADRNKNIFWLVTVIPKREGFYTIRHIYQNVDGWGYKNNSYEYRISVAKKGVRRFVDYNNRRLIKQACYDLWLGDSITIPISLDEHITSHTFSDENRSGSGNFDKRAIDDYHNFIEGNFSKWDIRNRVSELEFIGIKNDKMPHRNLGDSTVKYYAIFRAKEPGKFNLNIEEYQSIPITILPKKESIKTLVGHAGIYQWDDRESSSYSETYYWLENACLRVDDILIVTFMNYVENLDNKREIKKKLEINKTDFSILNKGYDYWIED